MAPVQIAAAAAVNPRQNDDPAPEPAVHEAPASLASVPAVAVTAPLVTITGCLEISTDGDSFRLSDVEGADAPKSRSWRSGFLKKRPAPVALVDYPDGTMLTSNVGHRVAATGQLESRDLRVSSLRVVGPCN